MHVRVGGADDAHRTCGEQSALLEAAVGQPRASPAGGTATTSRIIWACRWRGVVQCGANAPGMATLVADGAGVGHGQT